MMMDNPKISIVIVNYNTPEYTAQCLDSLAENPSRYPTEIIVVDNASTDDSADWLESHYPDINLIRSSENRGIAGGNNLGIRASTAEYVLLLNNDTVVIPGTLDRVIDFLMLHPESGGVGGVLLNSDGSFQSGACNFASLWQVFLIISKIGLLFRPYYPSNPPRDSYCETDWMSTAFMLFRRKALESVNLVDEEYFIYSDESDLQYRLKKEGWNIYHLPDVKTIHFGGKSLNPWRRRKMVYRGYLLFFRNHYPRWQEFILRSLFIFISGAKLGLWAIVYIWPGLKKRSKLELKSNFDILQMCLQSGIVPAK